MKKLYFATTNQEKLKNAQIVCSQVGITIKPASIDIYEIQGEDPEAIVRDKARRSFEVLGEPVVVSDDSWDIKALNGFPGPYMKSINYWFSPQDFIRLMQGVEDRRVVLSQYLVYTDGGGAQVFRSEIRGQIVHEPRGSFGSSPNAAVIAIDSDDGKTIAEAHEQDDAAIKQRYENRRDAWHEFIEWYKK